MRRKAFRKDSVEYVGNNIGIYAMKVATYGNYWIIRLYRPDKEFSAVALKIVTAKDKNEVDKILRNLIKEKGESGLIKLYNQVIESKSYLAVEKEKERLL